MRINFVGSFTTGYVGETSDETHLSQELINLGHDVNRIPRDVWKAYCDGEWNTDWSEWISAERLVADINIICKWHHFNHGKYASELRRQSNADVFYWTWDWMTWPRTNDFHKNMAQAADLHLTNELGDFPMMEDQGVNAYYFPMDVVSDEYGIHASNKEIYDVTFFGSCIGQGARKEHIKKIAEKHDVTIFAWNPQDWQKEGLNAKPAVYGNEFNKAVSQSKICLQFSTTDHVYGYWSNRVGKVLSAGGLLLARFVPGMELAVGDAADYFTGVDEAIEKIDYYLNHPEKRMEKKKKARNLGRMRFTSKARMKDLEILIERYLKGGLDD